MDYYSDFYCHNTKYWEDISTNKDEYILIEGHLAEYGPNYLIRMGIIAKALEISTGSKPIVLLKYGPSKEYTKKKLFESFKIKNTIGMIEQVYKNFSFYKKNSIYLISMILSICYSFLYIFNKKKFLKVSMYGIKVGDLIYDDIIRSKKSILKKNYFEEIYYIFKLTNTNLQQYHILTKISNLYKIKYYVCTHSQYVDYGFIFRFFYKKNIIVIESTDDQLFICLNSYKKNAYFPKYHPEVRKLIEKKLSKIQNEDKLLKESKMKLKQRFEGKMNQVDTKLAFNNEKIIYNLKTLKSSLYINNNNPCVFIMAHVFKDAPQGISENLLFSDYLEWIIQTIKYISNIKSVNWIIKEHPASHIYNEKEVIQKIIRKYTSVNNSIYVCPDNFNTASILEVADAIITCTGTAGLEFSCFGIPVILAGKPFYSDFGFTYESQTIQEYYNHLKNISSYKKLNSQQIKYANTIYNIFDNLFIFNKDNSLIDTIIKNKVWGNDGIPDSHGAYYIMTERIKEFNPKETVLYQIILKYFSKLNQNKIRLKKLSNKNIISYRNINNLSENMNEIKLYSRIAIWGSGQASKSLINKIKKSRPDIKISFLLDSFKENLNAFPPIYNAFEEKYKYLRIDCIIIASMYWGEIGFNINKYDLFINSTLLKYEYNTKNNVIYYSFIQNIIKLFEKSSNMIFRNFFLKLPSSVKGHYNIKTNSNFYKILFLNKYFFKIIKNNLEKIKQNLKHIYPYIVPMSFYTIWKIDIIRYKKLEIISECQKFDCAYTILKKLHETIDNNNYISDEINLLIKNGLKVIKNILNDDELLYCIENFIFTSLNNIECSIGPCHSDFHIDNIMKGTNNDELFMIDIDCFRINGYQFFDVIYFANQDIAKLNNVTWYQALLEMIKNPSIYSQHYNFINKFININYIKIYCFIYSVERIGQDAQFNNINSQEIYVIIAYFIKEFNIK